MQQQPLTASKKLLVLVMTPGRQDFDDLLETAKEIERQASDILIHIVTPRDTVESIPAYKWQWPALTVSFSSSNNFTPPRGRIFENRPVKKLDQHARFRSCGINTPHTERFEYGRHYDEEKWGEFCVLKPLPLTNTSKGVAQLIRTRRLGKIRPTDFPDNHFIRLAPALVQQFINTGKNPAYHRVMTIFGTPLYWWRGFIPVERPDLSAADAEIESAIIEPKNPAIKEKFEAKDRREMHVGTEFFDFAARMHMAFPDIPLKGNDILKEEKTGTLYAIEMNGGGNVWHFSSAIFEKSRNQMGGRDALIQHYNPWPTAARVLIEKTREFAT